MNSDLLPFNYQFRRSNRASKTRIIVKPGQVEVVAPYNISDLRLHQFIHAQKQWILDSLAKLEKKTSPHAKLAPELYHHGAKIPYLGSCYPLSIQTTPLKRVKIEFFDNFIAHVPENLPPLAHHDAIKQALTAWMKKQLKLHVDTLIQQHGTLHQLFPRSIIIKTQKSRWGSCGIHNDISINLMLILAPLNVIEYVVVHELCHIKVRNHSPQFWALVAQHLPDYPIQIRWLKFHGPSLMSGF
ncbi:MAG: M48 family metallopeptidase [Gammaproteobacteria bacterium]